MKNFVLSWTILCSIKQSNHKHIGCIDTNDDDMTENPHPESNANEMELNSIHTWFVVKSLVSVNVT